MLDEAVSHCREEYPYEACGILAGKDGRITRVYRVMNVSANPRNGYFMNPREQVAIFKDISLTGTELLGFYHSHPNGKAFPSAKDIDHAYYPDITQVIISMAKFDQPQVFIFKIRQNQSEPVKRDFQYGFSRNN